MLYLFLHSTVLTWVITSVVCDAANFSHVGCYNASYTLAHYGTVIKPLTLEMCIRLCQNQMTVYATVQSKKQTCYCINDLDQLTVVSQSYCLPCFEDTSYWCGGDDVSSLYQVKPTGTSPLGVLLATDAGITMVTTDKHSNSSQTSQLSETSTTSVAYHYKNKEIYFASENNIMKLSYIPLLMDYIHPQEVIEGNCNGIPDLDVDWEKNLLYWACGEELKAANVNGKNIDQIFYNAVGLKYIQTDPFLRIFFYTRANEFEIYDGVSFKSSFLQNEYNFNKVFQMALDIQQEIVYVIGSFKDEDDGKRCLVSLNYECTIFKVLYQGPELANAVGLDVVNGTIVWCSEDNYEYRLYRGTISVKGHLEKVTAIFTGTQKVNSIKIYHPDAQRPGVDHLCKEKSCSHSCSAVTSNVVQCSCPMASSVNFTSVLADDGRTCTEVPNYLLHPQTTTSSTSTLGAESEELSSTEDPTSSTDYTFTSDTSGEFKTWSSIDHIKTVSVPAPLIKRNSSMESTQAPKQIVHQSMPSPWLILSSVFILVLVLVIPFQVYLVIWLRRTNNTLQPLVLYNKQSELLELTHDYKM